MYFPVAGPIKLLKMMDALSVVSQLRDLASEPQNREVIVQDQGCLPGLVLFLDHQNPDVLFATLQVPYWKGFRLFLNFNYLHSFNKIWLLFVFKRETRESEGFHDWVQGQGWAGAYPSCHKTKGRVHPGHIYCVAGLNIVTNVHAHIHSHSQFRIAY